MKKGYFYICIQREGVIMAEKVSGYIEGDVGAHKDVGTWRGTHIETGLLLVRDCLSARQALDKAKALLENGYTDVIIKERMKEKVYRQFDDSRYAQSKTEVL